ncbi:MAG: PD-(D/E)XK nuclease family protein [Bacteroidetes bacterium]|nr:PD-(D/E)XK nuclease family protein [Bacteroidota bacterium]
MQTTFLKTLAQQLSDSENQKTLVVFPSKRAGEYFRNLYAENPPEITTIEEFITHASGLKVLENRELIVVLYRIYKSFRADESFEDFYGWGNMLLRDYDEIDRYLANPKRIFANLSSIKQMENLPEEDEEALKFWSTIDAEHQSPMQQRFLELWELFEKCYYLLNKKLLAEGKAYTGMAYRAATEKLIGGEVNLEFDKIIFAGFNAFSKAEETIIKHLIKQGKAEIYWDTDRFYLENKEMEAGYFIRRAAKNLGITKPNFVIDELLNSPKKIEITGIPLVTNQVEWLKNVMAKLKLENRLDANTVVVLPDESLLPWLMATMGEDIQQFNITAGYPLALHPFHSLAEYMAEARVNFKPDLQSYYYKDVMAILRHPLLDFNASENEKMIASIIKNNWSYINKKFFAEEGTNPILKLIFGVPNSIDETAKWLLMLLDFFGKQNSTFANYHLGIEMLREIIESNRILLKENTDLNPAIFHRFYKQAVSLARLPVHDEDLSKPQLMGTLESRCLDFENVIILGMNEGSFPASGGGHSYLPFDIRKGYGMPTFDEQDNLSAYYFYRLIQRAERVYLGYNTDTSQPGVEASRYIRQIEYLLAPKNPKIEFITTQQTLNVAPFSPLNIQFEKDENYTSALIRQASDKGFSPSGLSTYFTCSLQFYLRYVAKLYPVDEVEESLEANTFGTLFHEVMERFYTPFVGKQITKETMAARRKQLQEIMDESLVSLKMAKEEYRNQNSLLLETIKILADKTLELDAQYVPFKIIDLEKKHYHSLKMPNLGSINFNGTIDRVDEKGGIFRVIDYKTGKAGKYLFNWETDTLNPDNKEAFQAMFYTWIYEKQNAGASLKPNILPLKDLYNGYQTINKKEEAITAIELLNFEKKLQETIAIVFSKDHPITQTEDTAICGYCDYKNLCLR